MKLFQCYVTFLDFNKAGRPDNNQRPRIPCHSPVCETEYSESIVEALLGSPDDGNKELGLQPGNKVEEDLLDRGVVRAQGGRPEKQIVRESVSP